LRFKHFAPSRKILGLTRERLVMFFEHEDIQLAGIETKGQLVLWVKSG
jgi:hypothetical protein